VDGAAGGGGRGAAPGIPRGRVRGAEIPEGGLSLEALERALLLQAIEKAKGNKSAAARLLGLTRRTLYSRMEKHGLGLDADAGEANEAADAAEERP
jgi:transcriptional regulator of acetoin/glycerol metabolism